MQNRDELIERDFSKDIIVIECTAHLSNLINSLSVAEAKVLIKQLCQNKDIVTKVFEYYSDFTNILPDIKNNESRDKVFEIALSDEHFQRIFKDSNDVNNLVYTLNIKTKGGSPWPLELEVVNDYLSKLEKKLIVIDEDFFNKAYMCDEYHKEIMLKCFPTIEESRQLFHSKEEVIEKSRILSQGNRSQSSFFNKLPTELLPEIAKHTRTSSEHREEDAENLAKSNMNKPNP